MGGIKLDAQFVGAIIAGLIILGGLFAIVRNLVVFFIDLLRGADGKPWSDRPYLFRALAWIFTLVWLFGPYAGRYDVLHLTHEQQQFTTLGLFVLTAAAWLWVLRVSFLDGIPQQLFHLRTRQTPAMSWQGIGTLTYLFQLLCAIGLGVLFVFVAQDINPIVTQVLVVVLLLGTGFMSVLRMNYIAGADHTLGEKIQHVLGGRDAGQPHEHER